MYAMEHVLLVPATPAALHIHTNTVLALYASPPWPLTNHAEMFVFVWGGSLWSQGLVHAASTRPAHVATSFACNAASADTVPDVIRVSAAVPSVASDMVGRVIDVGPEMLTASVVACQRRGT